ncbi:MAG: D-alanyl-D-alanine carboxypeptidase [Bacilli bacterium]|nr:D-alanyl-D-alanine carboxypeptidase [Bacilli bacterium]MDD4298755.1 D-alanyl-D-alanine carboxypeptidase [Bacilli bacterium]
MRRLVIWCLSLLVFVIPAQAITTSGDGVILMDQDSGRILYNQNIHKEKLIASTTKIMTAILAIESNQLDDIVTIDDSILKAYGSCVYIEIGEEITLRDLVYGLMLRSGNDAALAIANYLGGLDYFVDKMNQKAIGIGMNQTNFINPHGLDEERSNSSTAYDMAILTKYANQYDEYKNIVSTKKHIVKTNYKTYVWLNKNKLLSSYKYTTGGKTGYTEKARRTLVTTATKDNLNLIVVTLDDGNDWNTHQSLYEYAFNKYNNYHILNKDKFNVDSDYYKEKLYILNDYYYPLAPDETTSMSIKIRLHKLKNYKDGDIVGEALVYYKDEFVHKEDVYVKIPVSTKKSFWQYIIEWFKK